MILAVDTGNTHTVLGCINEKNEVTETFQIRTDPLETAYEYAVELREIMDIASIDPKCFSGSIISSVVPQVNVVLSKAIQLVTGLTPFIIGSGVRTGLNILMDDPGTIAGDLVATAVAAKMEYPLPAIIVDMGTATTITVVDQNGNYIGGCIMPGVGISLDAMVKETALLPSIDYSAPKKIIGKNTIDAIKGGILFGAAGAVDGVLDRYIEELGGVSSIITTGGMGRLIAPFCRHTLTVDNRLLLKGLGYIYHTNEAAKTDKRKKSTRKKTAT